MTNAQQVLDLIKSKLCTEGTTYNGNSGKFMYVEGKTTPEGTINGVVKKFNDAGESKTAGSFKILEDGTVMRFTGLPTKTLRAITEEVKTNNATKQDAEQSEAVAV